MTRREIIVVAFAFLLGAFALWWQSRVPSPDAVASATPGRGTGHITPFPSPPRPGAPAATPPLAQQPPGRTTPPITLEPVPPATPPPVGEEWKKAQKLRASAEAFTDAEIEEVCAFLENVVEVKGLPMAEAEDLCNGLMYRLERDATPERFADLLVKLLGSKSQRASLRDDAAHHLALWCNREKPTEAVRAAFWMRSEDISGRGGPTSLLALRRMDLNAQLPPEETARLLAVCRQLVREPEATDLVKLTALEILSTARDPAALPAAREMIFKKRTIALTIVALGTIGAMGDNGDIYRLHFTHYLDRKGLEAPLKQALEKLEARVAAVQVEG